MNLFSLEGQVAIITGSSRGIGRAIALRMAEHGAKVVVSSRKVAACEEVVKSIQDKYGKDRAIAIAANISSKDNLANLVAETERHWGQVNVLVCNAASNPYYGPQAGIADEQFRKILDNNIVANHWLINLVAPQMIQRKAGSIIIVSSIAGVLAGPAFGPYSMTKHALEAFGKSLRAEMAAQGIDVTLLNPGPYNTGFNDRMADSMWEWFNEASVNAPATELHQTMRQMVTTNQMDPIEVVNRMVELVEASTTTENNFVPEGIIEMLTAQVAEA